MADTYSKDVDVERKYSHIKVPSQIVVYNFRKEAYDYININLRKLYAIPIDSTDTTDIGFLKNIESSIAAGNILKAIASTSEIEGIHQYGKNLIEDAEKNLEFLIDQSVILSGATKDTDDTDEMIDAPKMHGSSADSYATFDRPMSGIENDAIEGKVDSEKHNEVQDILEI